MEKTVGKSGTGRFISGLLITLSLADLGLLSKACGFAGITISNDRRRNSASLVYIPKNLKEAAGATDQY